MGDLKIPFGVDANGRMVSAEFVSRGADCDCVCPECSSPLIAAKGEVLRHHFRHIAQPASCRSALETSLHKFAKQVICESGNLLLPKFGDWKFEFGKMIEAHQEYRLSNINLITDVFAIYSDERIAIEIYVSHAVDREKAHKYSVAKQTALEIDLSNERWKSATEDEWKEIILRQAFRRWIVLPKIAREWQEKKRREEFERKVAEMEAAERLRLEAEEKRVGLEKVLAEMRENARANAAAELEKRKAEESLRALEQAERLALARKERIRKEAEEKERENKNAELREAMEEQKKHDRKPPDMQALVNCYGGYHLVPPEAWDNYRKEKKIWMEKHLRGAFYW